VWSWRCDACDALRRWWHSVKLARFEYRAWSFVVFVAVVLVLGGLVEALGLA
jgi:hypothetical protein